MKTSKSVSRRDTPDLRASQLHSKRDNLPLKDSFLMDFNFKNSRRQTRALLWLCFFTILIIYVTLCFLNCSLTVTTLTPSAEQPYSMPGQHWQSVCCPGKSHQMSSTGGETSSIDGSVRWYISLPSSGEAFGGGGKWHGA